MPLTPRVEALRVRQPALVRTRLRVWREWCFIRAIQRQLGWRLLLLVSLLGGGGALFRLFETQKELSYAEAVFYTFSLIFGQPPESFPSSGVLQVLFFLVPITGLTVLIESMVELAQLLRDRKAQNRTWSEIMAHSLKNHVILVGLGRVGWRTYKALSGLGVPLVVIDVNDKGEFLDDVRRSGTPLLIGDARREAMLVDAGVERARAIILATNDDLANLEVALDARSKSPKIQVVLRMFDQNMADKVHAGFGIRATLSTAALAAPTFAAAAIVPNVIATTVLEDQLILMVDYVVGGDDGWEGRTLGDLMEQHGVGVVRLRRAAVSPLLFPPPSTKLERGDELIVQGAYERLLGLALGGEGVQAR